MFYDEHSHAALPAYGLEILGKIICRYWRDVLKIFTNKGMSSKGFETPGSKKVIFPPSVNEPRHCVSYAFEYICTSFIYSFIHTFI